MAVTVFCSGTKPAEAPPSGRQIFRQAVAAEPGELDEACRAGGRGLGDGQPERLEGKRQRRPCGNCRSTGRASSSASTSGLSARAVELDLDDVPARGRSRREARRGSTACSGSTADLARWRRGSCAHASASAAQFLPLPASWPGAGRAACTRGSRIVRLAANAFHGQRCGLLLLAKRRQAVGRPRSAPMTRGNRGGIDERQPVLGREYDRRRPARREQRRPAGPRLDTRPRRRRSAAEPSAAIRTRSPAPIEPSDGIIGWTPALSAATRSRKTPGEMPDPPTREHGGAGEHRRPDRIGIGSGSPTAAAAAGKQLLLEGAGVAGQRQCARLAPRPVFSP